MVVRVLSSLFAPWAPTASTAAFDRCQIRRPRRPFRRPRRPFRRHPHLRSPRIRRTRESFCGLESLLPSSTQSAGYTIPSSPGVHQARRHPSRHHHNPSLHHRNPPRRPPHCHVLVALRKAVQFATGPLETSGVTTWGSHPQLLELRPIVRNAKGHTLTPLLLSQPPPTAIPTIARAVASFASTLETGSTSSASRRERPTTTAINSEVA